MSASYDLAIVGSGFAGSVLAMMGRRLGLSVVLVEKGRHPRVVIGESSTPLSNLLLETLAEQYDLPWLHSLTKWGRWQTEHPGLPCGLKRGFSFFHHHAGQEVLHEDSVVDRQLLVAASPNDAIADTHWFRAEFDHYLVQKARDLGVAYIEDCDLQSAQRRGATWRLQARVNNTITELGAAFLIDATGPRGCLHKLFGLADVGLPCLPQTSALYSHFNGVAPFTGKQHYEGGAPPYPPDAAALHHVFDGGWMWVLHFNNGWTSAGVAAEHGAAERLGLNRGEAAWAQLLGQLPEVQQQFATAQNLMPFTYMQQLSFRSSQSVGEGWAMLPSAAGFVDPLLSTGFPLALLGVLRLGDILQRHWGSPELQAQLTAYAAETDQELLATAELIGALYANMDDFATFRTLTLLYFAAASYAETVRRLGRPERARSFLLQSDVSFGPECQRLTARARRKLTPDAKILLREEILALVSRYDVAGLTKRPTDHCYPVLAQDLFANADKLGASRAELEDMLRRAGFQSEATTTSLAAAAL